MSLNMNRKIGTLKARVFVGGALDPSPTCESPGCMGFLKMLAFKVRATRNLSLGYIPKPRFAWEERTACRTIEKRYSRHGGPVRGIILSQC
jgi:hypothetical protein